MANHDTCLDLLKRSPQYYWLSDYTQMLAFGTWLYSLNTPQAARMLGSLLRGYFGNNYKTLHTHGIHYDVAIIPQSNADPRSPWETALAAFLLIHTQNTTRETIEVYLVEATKEQSRLPLIVQFIRDLGKSFKAPIDFRGIEKCTMEPVMDILRAQYVTDCSCYTLSYSEWNRIQRPSVSLEDSPAGLQHNLVFSELNVSDLVLIRDSNKIKYPLEYLEQCMSVSVCIRNKNSGELVAWGMAHADYEFGCIYTIEKYRRLGLAKYILIALGDRIVEDFFGRAKELWIQLGDSMGAEFVLQSAIEDYNTSSRALFSRFGFKDASRSVWVGGIIES